MKDKVLLGIIQMKVQRDKQANIEKAIKNIDYLAERGAEIIVLPEMFNCPYETDKFPSYAEREDEGTISKLSQIAKEKRVFIVAGSIPERDENLVYNTSFIFNQNGEIVGKHRKMHLFDINIVNGQYFRESDTLTAGKNITVVDTPFGKMGVAVCFDLRFPELARLMVEEGAKFLVYPAAFNMTTGPAHWELLFRSRAVDNQVFMIGCAPARNSEASYVSYGNSIIVSPWGEIMGRLDGEEGYLLGAIDLSEVDAVRNQLPLINGRRKDVYEITKK